MHHEAKLSDLVVDAENNRGSEEQAREGVN